MKLISVKSAKAIWLVPIVNVNPRGRFLLPAVPALIERYKFAKPPDLASLTATPTKIAFEIGSFVGFNGVPISVSLTLHDDGFVAETRSSTEECELFLEDAMAWLSSEFQLPSPAELGIRKLYTNEVYVRFDRPISVFNERFSVFANSLSTGLGSSQQKSMELIQLNFGTDPGENAQAAVLRIEREAGTPFAEKRYYSFANASTSEHLKKLEEFERLAS